MMGRETTTRYICDWCACSAPGEKGAFGGDAAVPKTWEYIDPNDDPNEELLCGECVGARKAALDATKAARRAGIPLAATVSESTPEADK